MDIKTDTRQTWHKIWSAPDITAYFQQCLSHEQVALRFKKMQEYLKHYCSLPSKLNIIELGSGMGMHSLLLGRMGAQVTLLDVNQNVLDKTKSLFRQNGIAARFLTKDAFNLAQEFRDKFDLAMSFGFVEHFKYPERFTIIKAHYDLIRPGGILAVGVPNILFFPHEMIKLNLRIRKKWNLGYEKSFSRTELKKIAKRLGLKYAQVVGSGFIYDCKRYVQLYRTSRIGNRLFGRKQEKYEQNHCWDKQSIFDNLFGADILLLGVK